MIRMLRGVILLLIAIVYIGLAIRSVKSWLTEKRYQLSPLHVHSLALKKGDMVVYVRHNSKIRFVLRLDEQPSQVGIKGELLEARYGDLRVEQDGKSRWIGYDDIAFLAPAKDNFSQRASSLHLVSRS